MASFSSALPNWYVEVVDIIVIVLSTVDKSIYCYQRQLKFWSHFISRVLSPRGCIKHSHCGYVGLREDVSGPSKGFDAKTSFGLISNHSCLVASCHIVPCWYDEDFHDDIIRISPIIRSCLRSSLRVLSSKMFVVWRPTGASSCIKRTQTAYILPHRRQTQT